MDAPFLTGRLVDLRPLHRADLDGPWLAWLNDPEVTRYTETGRTPTTREGLEKFYAEVAASGRDVMFAIVTKDGRHVGNCKLGSIHPVHRTADFGILLGAKDTWGQGLGTEATRLVLAYAFRSLNLHKVTLGVVADHKSAIRAYEKAGFRTEGVLKEQLWVESSYSDKVVMGVTAADFEARRR